MLSECFLSLILYTAPGLHTILLRFPSTSAQTPPGQAFELLQLLWPFALPSKKVYPKGASGAQTTMSHARGVQLYRQVAHLLQGYHDKQEHEPCRPYLKARTTSNEQYPQACSVCAQTYTLLAFSGTNC